MTAHIGHVPAPDRMRTGRGARSRLLAGAVGLTALLVSSGLASAHVGVLPTTVTQGEPQEFTIRVPNERDIPTTAVRVEFPDEITVYSFAEPPAGWTMRPILAPDGLYRGVEYRGEVGASRYVDFTVLGTPFTAGEAQWSSRQTYADGQVKPWTAAPEVPGEPRTESGPTDPGPVALVKVLESGEAGEAATPTAAADSGGGGSSAAIWLGAIAIGISLLGALGVGLLWSTRPARLPEDD